MNAHERNDSYQFRQTQSRRSNCCIRNFSCGGFATNRILANNENGSKDLQRIFDEKTTMTTIDTSSIDWSTEETTTETTTTTEETTISETTVETTLATTVAQEQQAAPQTVVPNNYF